MESKSSSCSNDPDKFCYICTYVCGEFTMKNQRKPINDIVIRLYCAYFGIEIGNQGKAWVPHIVCKICIEHLQQWEQGTRKSLKFGIPMIWQEPKNHHDDCYFCMTTVKSINKSNRSTVPILDFYREVQENEEDEMEISEEEDDDDSDYCGETSSPTTFSQGELSDLPRLRSFKRAC